MKNSPVADELLYAGGRKSRHDEASTRSSRFCERA